jgi:hypothetical protein
MDYIKQAKQQKATQEKFSNSPIMNSKKFLELNHQNTSPLFNSQRVKTLSDSSLRSSIYEHSFIEQIPSTNTNGIESKLRI